MLYPAELRGRHRHLYRNVTSPSAPLVRNAGSAAWRTAAAGGRLRRRIQIKREKPGVSRLIITGAIHPPGPSPYLARTDDHNFRNTFRDIAHIVAKMGGDRVKF